MKENEEKYTYTDDGYFQKAGKWFPIIRTIWNVREYLKGDGGVKLQNTVDKFFNNNPGPGPGPGPGPDPGPDLDPGPDNKHMEPPKWGYKEYGLASAAVGLGAAGLYYALSKSKSKRRSKSRSKSKRRSKSRSSRSKSRSRSRSSE